MNSTFFQCGATRTLAVLVEVPKFCAAFNSLPLYQDYCRSTIWQRCKYSRTLL